MTLGQPRPPGQVEKSPGSALAILLGLALVGGLAMYALTRKPAPPQPVPPPAQTPQVPWPQTAPAPAAPAFPETPPAPPPVAELVGEQSTDQPELVPVQPPAKPDENEAPPAAK